MPLLVACPNCRQSLSVPDHGLGKSVRCPRCSTVFVAQAQPAAPPAPSAPPQPTAPHVAPGPPPLPPSAGEAFAPYPVGVRPPGFAPSAAAGPPGDFKPLEFVVGVKSDPEKVLKGHFKARLAPDGLRLSQSKKPDLLLPIGTPARHLEKNRFSVLIEGREVELQALKLGGYQQRLTADVVALLNRQANRLDPRGYTIEWYLMAIAVLPLILVIVPGGALWGAVGGGTAAACLGIAQQEKLPAAARLAISLGLSLVVFLIVIIVYPHLRAAMTGR
jgi:predicted Zn finger-like uncharacterized protein